MQTKPDPIAEWGATAAIIVLGVAMLGAVALMLYGVMNNGQLENLALPAVLLLAGGAAAAAGLLVLQKRAERKARPAWMAHTNEWREEMKARLESPQIPKPGSGSPPQSEP